MRISKERRFVESLLNSFSRCDKNSNLHQVDFFQGLRINETLGFEQLIDVFNDYVVTGLVKRISFGEPGFAIKISDKHVIEFHFWRDGSIAIHNHSFKGYFKILKGSSLHFKYSFDNCKDVTNDLRYGSLVLKKVEPLVSDSNPTKIDVNLIHTLLHLASETVVVTVRKAGSNDQFDFFNSGIALKVLDGEGDLLERLVQRKKDVKVEIRCAIDLAIDEMNLMKHMSAHDSAAIRRIWRLNYLISAKNSISRLQLSKIDKFVMHYLKSNHA